MIWLLVAGAFAVSLGGSYYLARPGAKFSVADLPNERSLHSRPIPRGGGLAVVAGILLMLTAAAVMGYRCREIVWLMAPVLVLAGISSVDDHRSLSAGLRLGVHFFAALVLAAGGIFPDLPVVLCILALVWLVNLYNFMDGMDGLAGGMTAFGFVFLAWFGWQQGAAGFVLLALLTAAAAGGFLVLNFPPARLFMGDVGSVSLGFLAGGMSFWGIRDGLFSPFVPILIFSPFIIDATVTLLRRLLQGEKIWRPHRTHYYQRLVQLGWGHKKTVLAEYGLMTAVGTSSIAMHWLTDVLHPGFILTGWALLYGGISVTVKRLEAKNT